MNPWAAHNPNTQHQLWSKWVFTIYDGGRRPSLSEITTNFAKWIRLGFGSVGQVKVETKVLHSDGVTQTYYVGTAIVEGVPVHDPQYVASVRIQFLQRFVTQGFGPLATCTVEAKLLAGDAQDGTAPAQLLVLPSIRHTKESEA